MTGTDTGRCASTAPHPAHRWALGRQVVLCQGLQQPTSDPEHCRRAVNRAMEHVLVEEYGSLYALGAGFHTTIDQIRRTLALVLQYLPPGKEPSPEELERIVAGMVGEAYRDYLAGLDAQALALRAAAAGLSEQAKQQLQELLQRADAAQQRLQRIAEDDQR